MEEIPDMMSIRGRFVFAEDSEIAAQYRLNETYRKVHSVARGLIAPQLYAHMRTCELCQLVHQRHTDYEGKGKTDG